MEIRDIWVKIVGIRDIWEKLSGYGIFKKEIWGYRELKMSFLKAADKTRNMEHSGTSRNIDKKISKIHINN